MRARAVIVSALLSTAGCSLFPSLGYLLVDGGADVAAAQADASTDASTLDAGSFDATAAQETSTIDGAPVLDAAAPVDAASPTEAGPLDAAQDSPPLPIDCFGTNECTGTDICCYRMDRSSGFCSSAGSCSASNYVFYCSSSAVCASRGLSSLCCSPGFDDDGGLMGASCAGTCSGPILCDPLAPGQCPGVGTCAPSSPNPYSVCQ